MSDFKYDSYDQTSMRVAFEYLRQTERTAFYAGVLGGGVIGAFALKFIHELPNFSIPLSFKIAIPLLAGSAMYLYIYCSYGVYSWNARADYSEVASKVNRKYSRIINKVINYE